MKGTRRTTLGLALRAALKRNLEDAWLYLPNSLTPTANTECLIVAEVDSDLEPEEIAASLGFPQEGLDTQTLEGVATRAAQFEKNPSETLLIESFIYYWRFDAWLPSPGAPEPPPPEVAELIEAKSFYDSLGLERSDAQCKSSGCNRGAVSLSMYCRPHHFEMVRKKPSPFSH